ncbi:hypothetical protein RhiJN_10930 [Ceratobasidium sp. AG-Ba]|nr:hypothetical protein RhiJN_10930 [Ceratobasidium sp. AG-Ba]QRW11662.1 hypothetical protein RhiLY_10661 [Ceratobasidium sp. AG-Ba]
MVLNGNDQLQCLSLQNIDLQASYKYPTRPIELKELRILELDGHDVDSLVTLGLSSIKPGRHPLALSVPIPNVEYLDTRPILKALHKFVKRYNVTTLYVDDYGSKPFFASQLGPLPHVKTLVLANCCLSNNGLARSYSPREFDSYPNPCPVETMSQVLWPSLENLYLWNCVLEKKHMYELFSVHRIKLLYLRESYQEGTYPEEGYEMDFQMEQEYAQYVSSVVHKAEAFKPGWKSWPALSRLRTW